MRSQGIEQHGDHTRPGRGLRPAAQAAPAHQRSKPARIGATAHPAGDEQTQPMQRSRPVRRPFAMLAAHRLQTGGLVAQTHPAGGLVGMLASWAAPRHRQYRATDEQPLIGQEDIADRCGVVPRVIVSGQMIVAHLPDGVCRIRITTEPMFSQSEFVPLVLESMLEGENRLILDLGLVSMLHSPSLANLVTIHITLARRGSEMILTGLHEKNLRILSITKLDRLFTIQG